MDNKRLVYVILLMVSGIYAVVSFYAILTEESLFMDTLLVFVGLVLSISFFILVVTLFIKRMSIKDLTLPSLKQLDSDINERTYVWKVDRRGKITFMDNTVRTVLGYSPSELIGNHYLWEINDEDSADKVKQDIKKRIKWGTSVFGFENTVRHKDGKAITVVSTIMPLIDRNDEVVGLQGWDTDITYTKNLEAALVRSEKTMRALFENMNEGFVLYEFVRDETEDIIDYRIIDANAAFADLSDLDISSVKGKRITEIFNTEELAFIDKFKAVEESGEPIMFTRYFSGMKRYLRMSLFSPGTDRVAAVYTDITKEKDLLDTVEELSYKDKLTGLFNRRYYEENIPFYTMEDKLPLSIVIADLNALKVANDVFGHRVGDRVIVAASDILKAHNKEEGLLARVGGDEFVLLLPNTPYEQATGIIKRIRSESETTTVGDITLSMSLGLYTLDHNGETTYEKAFRHAESKLYSYKLKQSMQARKIIFQTVEKRLYTEFPKERQHAERVANLTKRLAEAYGLNDRELNAIIKGAYYHDIGKIILDNEIINGTTHPNDQEFLQVQRHSEIGYRILGSMTDMAHFSDIVLSHHENYDGTGYPRRLKGRDIPLGARMIRITESYDVMVNGLYKKPLSKTEAVASLRKYRGIRYCPDLLDTFLKDVLNGD